MWCPGVGWELQLNEFNTFTDGLRRRRRWVKRKGGEEVEEEEWDEGEGNSKGRGRWRGQVAVIAVAVARCMMIGPSVISLILNTLMHEPWRRGAPWSMIDDHVLFLLENELAARLSSTQRRVLGTWRSSGLELDEIMNEWVIQILSNKVGKAQGGKQRSCYGLRGSVRTSRDLWPSMIYPQLL